MGTPADQLILPGADSWESWPASANGAPSIATVLSDPSQEGGKVLALGIPTRYLTAVPLWLVKADPALYPDMIRLQLERRGLLSGGAHFRWKQVTQTDDRVLFLACLLSNRTPAEIHVEDAQRFEPSPSLRRVPGERLVLMRESGRLVAMCSIQEQLAAFQCLGDGQVTPDTAAEIQGMLLQLGEEQVLPRCGSIVAWCELSPQERQMLTQKTGLEVGQSAAPAPELPEESWELTPPAVLEARETRRKRESQRRWIAIAGGAWLLLAIAVAAHFFWLYLQARELRSNVQATAPTVERLRLAAETWRALEPAIEPDLYPVERLHRAARLLPEDGVRFTLYDQRVSAFLIRGEAKNAPAAFQYRDSLEKDPDWAGYTWLMPQPRLLPNNSAQFVLEGSRGYAPTDTQ